MRRKRELKENKEEINEKKKLKGLTIKELQKLLKEKGKKVSGNKIELINRLKEEEEKEEI